MPIRKVFCLIPIQTLFLFINSFTSYGQDINWKEGTLKGTTVIKNIDYLPGVDYSNSKDQLDIYLPKNATNAPIILFLHGGGLTNGNKTIGERLAARLIPEGFGIVSANYRLSPGVMHPAHTQDAAAAFSWVVKNIEKYGGDAKNIYISGHSAGAYLAVLIALDEQYLNKHGLTIQHIKGTIAVSPFLYVEETAKERDKSIWGKDRSKWLTASVTPQIDKGKRPFLLIYADGDANWRKKQNKQFGKAMSKKGNFVQIAQMESRNHVSLITGLNREDDGIKDAILEFVLSIDR